MFSRIFKLNGKLTSPEIGITISETGLDPGDTPPSQFVSSAQSELVAPVQVAIVLLGP